MWTVLSEFYTCQLNCFWRIFIIPRCQLPINSLTLKTCNKKEKESCLKNFGHSRGHTHVCRATDFHSKGHGVKPWPGKWHSLWLRISHHLCFVWASGQLSVKNRLLPGMALTNTVWVIGHHCLQPKYCWTCVKLNRNKKWHSAYWTLMWHYTDDEYQTKFHTIVNLVSNSSATSVRALGFFPGPPPRSVRETYIFLKYTWSGFEDMS